MTKAHFGDRLADAISQAGSPACVGIDPVIDRLPHELRERSSGDASAIQTFVAGVLDSVADLVPAVKFQAACFERLGAAGWAALERGCAQARERGLLVILDAKRGDIGLTAQHYARAATRLGADAITLNPYLGPDTIAPYLDEGLGVFVLVRTSNPQSDAVQSAALADGRTVAELIADLVAELGRARVGASGLSDVGAVVAATNPDDAASLRVRMPHAHFLVPGFGAQGGTVESIRGLFRPDRSGALVTASRSVLYPERATDWRAAIRSAAESFVESLR